jgi:hypothetical protein
MGRSSENGGTNDIFPQEALVFLGLVLGETQCVPEEKQNKLRTKMSVNPAQYRRIPEQNALCSLLMFTTISSTSVLYSFEACSGLVRESSQFTSENTEESRTSLEQVFDQSAMTLGERWERWLLYLNIPLRPAEPKLVIYSS